MASARSGRLDEARALLEHLRTTSPRDPDVLQLLGMLARQLGDQPAAIALFRQSLAVEPRQPHVLNNLGNACAATGQQEQALEAYGKALALKPDYADADINRALALIALGRASQAAEHMAALVRAQPGSARAWAVLGQALAAMGDQAQAVMAYGRALRLQPDHGPWLHNLAVALRLAGRPEESLPLFDRSAALSPDDPRIHYNRGHCLQDLGRMEEAAAAYRRAIALAPSDVDLHDSLSRLLWQQGDRDGHVASYRDALVEAPDDAGLLCGLAERLTLAGEARAAAALLADAAARGVGGADLRFRLGQACWSCGEPDRAFAAFEAALEIEPRHPPTLRESARCLIITDRIGEAMPRIVTRLDDDAHDQQALALQGLSWRLTGDVRFHWLIDPRLIGSAMLTPPGGDGPGFNRALDVALGTLHTARTAPLEQTLRGGTQTTDDLFARELPEIVTVHAMIRQAVERHIAALPDDASHPFLARKSAGFAFSGSWSVRLSSGGHHSNHIHPEGWISAVYYVAVPPAVGDGQSGWLKFGETGLNLGDREQILHMVRPQPGLLVLFPSYFYHGTVPFADTQHRTTIAFDIVPSG
jgi:uncharacterized protein (TIGR02466 family)